MPYKYFRTVYERSCAAICTIAVFCLAFQPKAEAQNTPGDSVKIPAFTLADTLRFNLPAAQGIFMQKNLTILAGKYRLTASEADIIGARLIPNPSISYNASDIGVGHGLDETQAQTGLRLDQSIELGGKRGARIEAAQHSVEAAHKDFEAQLFQMLENVRDNMQDVAYAKKQVDLAQFTLTTFTKLADLSDIRLKAGDIGEQDVASLELEELNDRQAVSDAEQSLIDAEGALKLTLGIDPRTPIDVDYELKPNLIKPSSDSLIAIAFENRAEVKASEARMEMSKSSIDLADANAWPDLDLGVELDREAPGWNNLYGAGIGISIPIFSRNQDEVQRSQANYHASQYDLAAEKNIVINDVETALQKYDNALAVFKSMPQNTLEKAEQVRDLAVKSFSLGNTGLLDLLTIERVYNDAVTSYYNSIYKLGKNQVALERAIGKQLF